MKTLSICFCSLMLVACGGGDEAPVAIISTSVPRPVANAATVSGGSAVAVHMYQALYGMAPSNATLNAHTVQATADPSAFARNLASNFASTSSTALAKLVLDNLGVTATTVKAVNGQGQSEYAILLDALGQMFAFYGTDARGQIILNATNLLAGLETDVTYGVTAVSYNNQTTANYSYSSNSSSAVATVVSTATANAGVAKSVIAGTIVTLDGSASKADVGKTLAYSWTLSSKPTGSSAAISSATSVKPTFTADVAGTYVASLVVRDGTANSSPATVTITAIANVAPVARAGAAQTVVTGSVVTLNGSGSSDANGDALSYFWTGVRPVGSTSLIAGATTVRPTFTADIAGTYAFTLVVNDGVANSAPATVTVTASNPVVQSACPHGVGSGTDGLRLYTPSNIFTYQISTTSANRLQFSTVGWGALYAGSTGSYTGSLKADLWASPTSYTGNGSIYGWVLGTFPANFAGSGAYSNSQISAGGYSTNTIVSNAAAYTPPAGDYCLVLTLSQYALGGCSPNPNGYCIVDWLQFEGVTSFR